MRASSDSCNNAMLTTAKTVREIQDCVRRHHGFVPKSCWIADVKERAGLPVPRAWNRRPGPGRDNPCPPDKRAAIALCLSSATP